MSTTDGNARLARADSTRTEVLALLGRRGPMSRAQMARELELSPGAIGLVTRRLIDQGLVEALDADGATHHSGQGRPGQLLGLVGTAGRAIGAKVAADRLTLVDMRLDGEVVRSGIEPFDATAPLAVAQLASRLQAFARQESVPLLGVGVCVPGMVDRPDLGNVEVPALGWSELALGRHLGGALGVPILVENGVKALAFAESLYGLGRSHRTFSLVTIGRGIGFAHVADGLVQRGAYGRAGEIGHCVVDPRGPRCWCGRTGCLEAFAGQDGLVAAARRKGAIGPRGSVETIARAAARGDAGALTVFADAARRLGRFIAATVATLDPEVLLVAGEGSAHWRYWEPAFLSELRSCAPDWSGAIRVEVDSWEDTSWAQGAAAIVLATPFDQRPAAGGLRHQVLARLVDESA